MVDSTTSVNVYKRPDLTPIKLGQRDQSGVQVNGGTETTRYFISLDLQKEVGPFGLPAFNKQRFDSLKVPLADHLKRPQPAGTGIVPQQRQRCAVAKPRQALRQKNHCRQNDRCAGTHARDCPPAL